MTDPLHLPLVLCNVAVADIPLRQVIPTAAEAGFEAITVVGSAIRRSIARDGLGPAELAAMVRDHGLVVTDVEAVGDWLAPVPTDGPKWLQPGYDEAGFLELCTVFGATTLVATHFAPLPPIEEAAAAFARLCDAAAERGVRVALEYPAMATVGVGDVGTAWAIVEGAGRPNGGLLHDLWHHDRSPGTDAQLAAVPADRIFSVQLSDASAERKGPPIEDAKYRTLIGDGDLGTVEILRALVARGLRCPIGIEVFFAFDERPAAVRIREFYDNLRAAAAAAGLDPDPPGAHQDVAGAASA